MTVCAERPINVKLLREIDNTCNYQNHVPKYSIHVVDLNQKRK